VRACVRHQAIVELVAGMKKRKEVGTGGSRGRKRRMAKILHPVPTGKMVAAGQPGVGPNGTTQWYVDCSCTAPERLAVPCLAFLLGTLSLSLTDKERRIVVVAVAGCWPTC
jgi:hypothetical protein